jgi:hypothetical protein
MIEIDKENVISELTRLNKMLLAGLSAVVILVAGSFYLGNRSVASLEIQEAGMRQKLGQLGVLENLYNTLAADNKTSDGNHPSLDNLDDHDLKGDMSPIDRVRAMAKKRNMVIDWIDDRVRKTERTDSLKGTGLSMAGTYPDFHLFLLDLLTRPFVSGVSEIQIYSGSGKMDIMMSVEFSKQGPVGGKDGAR